MSNYVTKPETRHLTHLLRLAGVLCLVMSSMFPLSARASLIEYDLIFTDKLTHAVGTGSFSWDSSSEVMSGLAWSFSGKAGSVKDSALARTYQSWNPLANTYGELFFRFLTEPQAYLIAQYGLISAAVGLMPSNVSGDFGFIAFGAEKNSSEGTYRFLNTDWSLATEGYVSASSVPEPSSVVLLLTGVFLAGKASRRKKRSTAIHR